MIVAGEGYAGALINTTIDINAISVITPPTHTIGLR